MTRKKDNSNINYDPEYGEKDVEIFLAIKENSENLNHWDKLVQSYETNGEPTRTFKDCETVWHDMGCLSSEGLLPTDAELAADDYQPDISVAAHLATEKKQQPSYMSVITSFLRNSLFPDTVSSRWPQYTGMIAASLLIIFLGLNIFSSENRLYQTHTAENKEIILKDGSHIILGAETTLRTAYSEQQRNVELQGGEAYFKVAKDASRPFIVHIDGLKVKAIGTAFNIRKSSENTTVSVIEGIVGVTDLANVDFDLKSLPEKSQAINPSRNIHATTLTVGEQVNYAKGHNLFGYKVHDPRKTLSWQGDVLFFSGEKLQDVFYTLNRYTTEDIIIIDPKIGNFIFSGTVNKHNIDQWFKGLSAVFPVTVITQNRRLLVSLKHKSETVSPN